MLDTLKEKLGLPQDLSTIEFDLNTLGLVLLALLLIYSFVVFFILVVMTVKEFA